MDNWELYDLKIDPNEMHNLYGAHGYDSLTSHLKVRLDELKKEFKMDKNIDGLREMTSVQIKRLYKVEAPN
jgi:hypothetical protein